MFLQISWELAEVVFDFLKSGVTFKTQTTFTCCVYCVFTTSINLKSPWILSSYHQCLNDHISDLSISVTLNHKCSSEHCWGSNLSLEDEDKDFQMWEGLFSRGAYHDLTLCQIKRTRLTSMTPPQDASMTDLNLEALMVSVYLRSDISIGYTEIYCKEHKS